MVTGNSRISQTRLARLKEATLRWSYEILHVPGKANVGPDALSRKERSLEPLRGPATEDTVGVMEGALVGMVIAVCPEPITMGFL